MTSKAITPENQHHLTHIQQLVAQRLMQLGELGKELNNPPDDDNDLWMLGVLSSTEHVMGEISTLQKAALIFLRESV